MLLTLSFLNAIIRSDCLDIFFIVCFFCLDWIWAMKATLLYRRSVFSENRSFSNLDHNQFLFWKILSLKEEVRRLYLTRF